MRRPRNLVPVALAAALLCLAAGCAKDDGPPSVPQTGNVPTTVPPTTTSTVAGDDGSGSATTAGSDEGAFPATVQAANGSVELAAMPHRIVSLSPTATEMLYAIGAGKQVVAVDGESDYPSGTPMSATLSSEAPSVDAILAQLPDLVLVHMDNAGVVGALSERRVPVLHMPAAERLDDSYAQLEQLGIATGHTVEAAAVVARMQTDIQGLLAQVPPRATPVSVYHEIDDDLFTTTSGTFIGELYRMAGFDNIADGAGDGGYPQISADQVLQRNPDWIFLAHAPDGDDPVAMLSGRGWSGLQAVQANRIVKLDPEIASRWGPRTVDLLRTILASTAAATSPTASTASTTGDVDTALPAADPAAAQAAA
jgi:iron complex transport system substrate-binding protein